MRISELAQFLDNHTSPAPALIFYGALSELFSEDVSIIGAEANMAEQQKAGR